MSTKCREGANAAGRQNRQDPATWWLRPGAGRWQRQHRLNAARRGGQSRCNPECKCRQSRCVTHVLGGKKTKTTELQVRSKPRQQGVCHVWACSLPLSVWQPWWRSLISPNSMVYGYAYNGLPMLWQVRCCPNSVHNNNSQQSQNTFGRTDGVNEPVWAYEPRPLICPR